MSVFLKIVPPLWMFLFLILGLLAHYLIPTSHVFDFSGNTLIKAAGATLTVCAWLISLRASNLFAIEKTEVLPTSPQNKVLITRGPFRWTRNPMYLGLVGMLIGIAIYMGTLPMFVAALALFCVMNFIFIPFEEGKMARQFGEAYITYKQTVRRWL